MTLPKPRCTSKTFYDRSYGKGNGFQVYCKMWFLSVTQLSNCEIGGPCCPGVIIINMCQPHTIARYNEHITPVYNAETKK